MKKSPTPKLKARLQPPEVISAALGAPVIANGIEPARSQAAILAGEIAALREAADEMWVHAHGLSDPLDAVKALSAYGRQIVRIAGLLRMQAALSGNSDDENTQAVIIAIQALAKEWKE